jgi:hypothetical protein
MSDNKLLERYLGRRSLGDGESEAGAEPDGNEDFGAFGWLRGPRERAVMLELRKKDGTVIAVAYGFINRVEFSPIEGITLRCGQEAIRIKGRGLNSEIRPQIRLFQGICRHRVPWIQEADPASLLRADKNAVIVEAVEW